jgi:hypothetical protein
MDDIADLINKYGFPIVAAGGLGYFVYYIWKWVTEEIDPVIGESNKVLIELIDRIRMLDNDLIRLNQKVNVILSLREREQDEVHKKHNIFTDSDE